MLLAFSGNSGSFSVITSISGISSGFLFPLVDMIFDGWRNVIGSVEGCDLLLERLYFFDIIVDKFAGIGRFNGRFVVGNHASRTGTLTP